MQLMVYNWFKRFLNKHKQPGNKYFEFLTIQRNFIPKAIWDKVILTKTQANDH